MTPASKEPTQNTNPLERGRELAPCTMRHAPFERLVIQYNPLPHRGITPSTPTIAQLSLVSTTLSLPLPLSNSE